MRKGEFPTLIAAVLGVALSGAAASAVELTLRLEEGKTYYQKLTVEQRTVQDMMGMQQTIQNSLGAGLEMNVLAVDDRGHMRIRRTYKWLLFKQVGPMSAVDYDSARAGAEQTPAGAEGFAALLGQSYTIVLGPQGQVIDVNGVDELREAIRKKVPAGAEGTPMMSALEPFISEQGIREMTKGTFAVYPGRPVEEGDSWAESMTIAIGPEVMVESKRTLTRRQGGIATITNVSTMRSNPDGPPTDAGGMKLRFDLSGTEQATTRVAEATGLILSNVSTQKLSGKIMVATSADAPPMMTVPVTIETATTTEMSDRMWKTDSR